MNGSMSIATVAQSALNPAGPQASRIEYLWWLIFWISTAVFLIVLAFLAKAIIRPREPSDNERSLTNAVTISVGATAVILLVWLVASIWGLRVLAAPQMSNAVSINLTGHQWWWEVEYQDPNAPSLRFRTANEIHIPVGRPVVLNVTSRDVIHSFWVPNLHGKRDLIPGYTTSIWLQADRAGVYRGQCAEFCGYQHANMALYVTAENDAPFKQWLAAERQPAQEPSTDQERHGRDVFMHGSCPACHTIRGTNAGGLVGPELTHIGTRGTIGAGTLPNTRGHLGGWISDAQAVKPGIRMPPNRFSGDDFQALLAYLESLK
jgi:cytochrome c oxidase subunit 2